MEIYFGILRNPIDREIAVSAVGRSFEDMKDKLMKAFTESDGFEAFGVFKEEREAFLNHDFGEFDDSRKTDCGFRSFKKTSFTNRGYGRPAPQIEFAYTNWRFEGSVPHESFIGLVLDHETCEILAIELGFSFDDMKRMVIQRFINNFEDSIFDTSRKSIDTIKKDIADSFGELEDSDEIFHLCENGLFQTIDEYQHLDEVQYFGLDLAFRKDTI